MFFALAASSLLFSACSSDDAVVSTEGQNEAVQQIVLQVASSGDGLTTRAGRPLYSSQALQTIQNVRVLIYNADTKAIVKDEKKDWKTSTTYTNHGRQLTLTYKGDDRLPAGSYKVMAVGYSDNSDYTYSLDVTGAAALTGNYSDITATLKAGKVAEEVFAGDAALTINADKKITNLTSGEEDGLDVTLHRQVAGSFGYFCNIPASVNSKAAATLRLVVRDKNDMLTFKDFNSSFTTTGSTIMYCVNGTTSTGKALASDAQFKDGSNGYVLYSIDLDTWFPGGDHNNDGVLNAEDTNWTHSTTYVNTQVVKGSVFGSNFVIPFNYAEGKNTMELQLLDAAGDIIKTWTVSIPTSDLNSNKANGAIDASPSIFNVVRNHMYNLGVKTSNGTTTPPDPSNPDPKPDPDPDKPKPGTDQPEDLTKSQNLILKVNDNWEAIHKLVLGD
ncbi:hypothetical protein KUA49_008080 [Segatella copri]|uniref:hypothetical protein n=1 Tax=Segatella copri TaxID=165179 RepID=UPI001C484D74|nr:hypothetical protein [Segatella copri]WOZ86303.1 hypothetical protein KUA49_008080 [Segatella copri]